MKASIRSSGRPHVLVKTVAGLFLLAAAVTLAACSTTTSGSSDTAPASSSSSQSSAGAATPPVADTTADTPSATVTPPDSTPTTSSAPAIPRGLVGTWSGHGRSLAIDADGAVHLEFRTYTNCSGTVTTGCDGPPGGTIHDGGEVTGQITAVQNPTTVTVTITSTSVPADVPLGPARLGHDTQHDAIALFAGRISGAPFCGNDAPRNYCGA